MKKSAGLVLLLTMACAALGQDASDKQLSHLRAIGTEEKTALDIFDIDGTYVFESEIDNDGDFGKQDVIQSGFNYSHRFLITGKIYLRLGVDYHRFDFGTTSAPLPSHLQNLSAELALEYMVGNDVGAFLQIDPGFYTENDFDSRSFDVPITLGRAFVLQKDKLYLFLGVNAAFLRGQWPVLPLVGLVYRASEQWTVKLVPPQPRIIYSPNDKIDYWLGGQVTGWSYRTEEDDNIVPHRLSNAQVDYVEYRAGLGFTWHPCDQIALDVAGGYVFDRRFNFDRAGETYTADPAPYMRVALKAEF